MPMNISLVFDKLLEGKLVEAAIMPYYDYLGGVFWMWAFGLSLIMLFGKNQNYGVITVVGLLIAPVVMLMIPSGAHLIIYFFIAVGVTGILYKLYH